MNYEKLNNNQVRFLLNKEDLDSRNLNLSSLTYGSQPVKDLFQEISDIALKEFNFDVSTSPVSIDAVPISDDELEIIISKDSDPEELDTRFSSFTPSQSDLDEAISNKTHNPSAKDVLDLLSAFNDTIATLANKSNNAIDSKNQSSDKKESLYKVFIFHDINILINLSKKIKEKYHGKSSLYEKEHTYYLIIDNNSLSNQEFNQICNIICEFGDSTRYNNISVSSMMEHYDLVIKNKTFEELSQI